MSSRLPRSVVVLWAVAAFLAVALRAQESPSRRDAETLHQKVSAIAKFSEDRSGQTHRTAITETELNAFLRFDAAPDLPEGVVDPSVTMLGTGRVSGRAVVNLDEVRQRRTRTSLFDPMNFVGGRMPLTATGVLTTSDGIGRFILESAAVGRLPIPKTLLQEIVGYYSRTPEHPAGIKLDDPFTLPANIREIQVEAGQAVIVQ